MTGYWVLLLRDIERERRNVALRTHGLTDFLILDTIEIRVRVGLAASLVTLVVYSNPHDRCLVHPGTRTTYVRYVRYVE